MYTRRVALVVALALALASGCSSPACVETYSPLVKILVGLPIPLYITMLPAAALMVHIRGVLRRSRRLPKGGLAAVAASCAVLPMSRLIASHGAAIIVALAIWATLLALVVILTLHEPGPDPKEQSWLLCLQGASQSSAADRFMAGMLAIVLLFVTLVGSMATLASVTGAGRECEYPAGSAD
ncbi:MAG: hypothetical protein R6X02_24200 [Enhygromyxa sp.]